MIEKIKEILKEFHDEYDSVRESVVDRYANKILDLVNGEKKRTPDPRFGHLDEEGNWVDPVPSTIKQWLIKMGIEYHVPEYVEDLTTIKITKCSGPEYWYKDYTGRLFNVRKVTQEEIDGGEDPNRYRVVFDKDIESKLQVGLHIDIKDTEELV